MALYKLLLVDDNPKTQGQVRSMFAREPVEVSVVDGPGALARIEADRPNLVLASVNKSVDGYAVAHYVSHNPQLQAVSVLLLLTPKAVNESRIAESGAGGFLLKPLRAGVVVTHVREALGISMENSASAPAGADAGAKSDLDTAFDAIDANLQNGPQAEAPAVTAMEHEVTTEALAQIVTEAVTQAIGAYERARHSPEQGHGSSGPHDHHGADASPAHDAQIERLQHEMGLDDLAFAEAPAPPAEPVVDPALAAEMGVTDFVMEDAPPVPATVTGSKAPDTPDEGVHWLADQLEVLREPQEEEARPLVEHHHPGGESIRHAVEVVRASVAHLSELVHHHAAIVPPPEQDPEPAASSESAPTPPAEPRKE
ncbi:MAG: response regulator [Vicinamibacterales bacterium]|jgi:CheY-like chemotaxis protein